VSAPLTTRDALAEVVLNNGIRSVRDASAYTSGADEAYCREVAEDIADALLASGALTDATKLAEDEALVERVVGQMYPPLTGTPEYDACAVRKVLRALAAALSGQDDS